MYHQAVLVASQQVKFATGNLLFLHLEWIKPGYVFFSTVANEESNPSERIQGFQSAVEQEAVPTTAQRRRELEHYLKLRRY